MANELRIPLFPLHTVLFPGGPLPLRIFEHRYLDMVSDCLKNDGGFGVVLIREGSETGRAPSTYEVGTFGRISYWHKRPDGLLGITVTGEQRFRTVQTEVLPNQLTVATVELIPNEAAQPLPEEHRALAQLLERIIEQLGPPYANQKTQFDDAVWVGGRLVELLPIPLAQKQYFLQLNDPVQRLDRLSDVLRELGMV